MLLKGCIFLYPHFFPYIGPRHSNFISVVENKLITKTLQLWFMVNGQWTENYVLIFLYNW